MSKKIINNIQNIYNSSNEVFSVETINRNLKKLYNNDEELYNFKQNLAVQRVSSYIKNYPYRKNDIVWYKTISPITNKMEIFILRSILSDNIHIPEPKITESATISFEDSGWVDCQEYSTYIQNDLSTYIKSEYSEKISLDHQNNRQKHKYGNIVEEDIPNLLLNCDLSNIDKDRRFFHFPYETISLEPDNTIVNGYYRKWDCGLIEYDIIFKLGYTGNKVEHNGFYFDEVKCNTVELSDSRYYMEQDDAKIFSLSSKISDEYIYINEIAETNHNEFINTYSSKINFPIPFINDNYMIFDSQFRNYCQDINNEMIGYNDNTLTYTNKFQNSVEPIYITYTKDQYTKSALVLNNFHCQIIGRWR